MARANRTAYARGERDGRSGATKIEPPVAEPVAKAVSQDSQDGEDFSHHVKVVKAAGEGSRIVFGVIMRPNVVDAHGEFADEALVKKTAHDFLAGLNTDNGLGVQHHDFTRSLDVVESTIETHDYVKHGLEIKAGDWTGSVRVNDDEIWSKVEKSELTGFSIGGRGSKRKATDDELAAVSRDETVAKSLEGADSPTSDVLKYTSLSINEWSLVDAPANEISFVVAKRRSKEEMKTSNAETPKDNAAELAAKDAKIAELEAQLAEASKPKSEPEAASQTDKPAEQNAAPNDAPPADDVKKEKRFTNKRKAEIKAIKERLDALLADVDDEPADGESQDSPEIVQKSQAAAPAPVPPAPVAQQTPAIDIQAEVQKALEASLKPLKDQIEEQKKTIASQATELEVIKTTRMPATRGTGNTVQKALGDTDIWASLDV